MIRSPLPLAAIFDCAGHSPSCPKHESSVNCARSCHFIKLWKHNKAERNEMSCLSVAAQFP